MPGVNKVHEVQELPVLDKRKEWITEEPLEQLEQDLSPCKQILWPSSGWIMIPLTNLKESSNVKKAYLKARLCLHPDKLQLRGATIPQKYVAEKAFPILQDAWAAFISQNVRSTIT